MEALTRQTNDRDEAQDIGAALAGWLTSQMEGGADPALLGVAGVGMTLDLLARSIGRQRTVEIVSEFLKELRPEG